MKFLIKLSLSLLILILFYVEQNIAAEIDSLSIEPVHSVAGSTSIHLFHFNFSDSVPSDAQLKITYPSEFDLGSVKLAGSNSIKGGLAVQVSGQIIIISRRGKGTNLQSGTSYDLAVANVTNGKAGDYIVSVQVLDANGTALGNIKTSVLRIEQ